VDKEERYADDADFTAVESWRLSGWLPASCSGQPKPLRSKAVVRWRSVFREPCA
jgi:hypothetical protein